MNGFKAVLLALGFALIPALALAQQPVATQPQSRVGTGGNASSTVAVTNTFQSLWSANTARSSCTVQNTGTNSQWVFFGPIASATKPKSVLLVSGAVTYCNSDGVVSGDQVSITGTSGDAFFAQQDGAPFISPASSGGGGGGGNVTIVGPLGQQVMASSVPVVIASDQTAVPISAASLPLPSGAATSALQTTGNTALGTINTTLGSPFQAGGSIGNTTFAVTQATASNLKAQVVGAGTAGAQTGGLLTVQGDPSGTAIPVSGTVTVSGVSTASNQTSGAQKSQIVDGSGNVIASTSNNLNVQCANCSGSGASAADEASFTAGTSVFAPSGGFFQTTATSNALTNGQQGFVQMTAQRAFFSNLRNASGTEVGTSTTPLQVSLANTGANATAVLVNQPTAASLNATVVGTGTFATQSAITAASGSIASGAIASGAVASGAVASGAYASGSISAGAIAAGATSLVKLEDVASADGDAGVPSMAIRKATPANTSGTDGDYEMLQMSAGRLWASATIDAALPAGTNVIGHVITDTGSTTAVTGTVTVTATNLSTNIAQVAGSTAATAATGVLKVGVTGNAGAIFDGATGAAVPANVLFTGLSDGTNLRGWLNAANALNSTGAGLGTAQAIGQFDDTSPTSITENQFGNLRMSANRNAYTTLRDAAGNERGANVSAGNALLVDGSATTQPVSYATTGSGNATGALRVELANNGTGVLATVGTVTTVTTLTGTTTLTPGTAAANLGKAEDAAIASGDTGVMALAVQIATPADSANDNDYSPLQMKNGLLFTSSAANTVGGASLATLTAANSTNATNVKASAGSVYGLSGYTISATAAWLSLYNNAGTPTCGTSIIQQFLIPGNASGSGFNIAFPVPKAFSTGIAYCLTTGIAGTGSVAASSYVVNVDYK